MSAGGGPVFPLHHEEDVDGVDGGEFPAPATGAAVTA
eukprot:gene47384-26332_t